MSIISRLFVFLSINDYCRFGGLCFFFSVPFYGFISYGQSDFLCDSFTISLWQFPFFDEGLPVRISYTCVCNENVSEFCLCNIPFVLSLNVSQVFFVCYKRFYAFGKVF